MLFFNAQLEVDDQELAQKFAAFRSENDLTREGLEQVAPGFFQAATQAVRGLEMHNMFAKKMVIRKAKDGYCVQCFPADHFIQDRGPVVHFPR